ncbi:MAG: hypothetical protein ONB12_09670 [candidate division KSB1 bacterium]|nr:hypothetical protein [candidate division KSB1 bacterium]
MGEPLTAEEKQHLDRHLSKCVQCRNAYPAVCSLYDQINNELRRPVHNKVLDLAKRLSSPEVEYGLLICRPIASSEPNPQAGLFFTELLFYANGSRFGAKQKLADYGREDLQDFLTIRAMSDLQDHKLLLYLWQANCDDFSGWKLKLADEEVDVSAEGKASIPLCGIKELHGKVIQIEKSADPSAF